MLHLEFIMFHHDSMIIISNRKKGWRAIQQPSSARPAGGACSMIVLRKFPFFYLNWRTLTQLSCKKEKKERKYLHSEADFQSICNISWSRLKVVLAVWLGTKWWCRSSKWETHLGTRLMFPTHAENMEEAKKLALRASRLPSKGVGRKDTDFLKRSNSSLNDILLLPTTSLY